MRFFGLAGARWRYFLDGPGLLLALTVCALGCGLWPGLARRINRTTPASATHSLSTTHAPHRLALQSGAKQATTAPGAYRAPRPTAPPKSPTIRVGLSTHGGPIVLWARGGMTITDTLQPGRLLTVRPTATVTFTYGAPVVVTARGQRWSGPIQIRTASGAYPAWQVARILVSGGPTHVATNGASPSHQRAYYGAFEVAPQTYSFEPALHLGPLRLVNILSLDDYLKGVVPWEMNRSAPLEALKAQAICARSEATAKIQAGRHRADGYDICDYDHCQGYVGTENAAAITDRAVNETTGQVILYGGHVADAVYGTNSGGITAAAEDVWHGPPEAYLRSVPDLAPADAKLAAQIARHRMSEADWVTYCTHNIPSYAQPSALQTRALASRRRASSSVGVLFQADDLPEFYRWTRVVTPAQLAQAVAGRVRMDYATELRALARAPSGHIKRLLIQGVVGTNKPNPKKGAAAPLAPTSLVLDGDSQIRAMLSGRLGSTTALPSSTFVVLPRRDGKGAITAFVLKGAGWGHGAGMCQRGAENHARAGWTARQIIQFYFHGIEVRKLY